MEIGIIRNREYANPKKKKRYERVADNFKEAKKYIAEIGKKLKYTDDYLIILYVLKDEFDKVSPFMPNIYDRKLDIMDSWLIFFDTRGLIVYEDLQNELERIIRDPFAYKADEINVGDYVYSERDNKYFIVGARLKDGESYASYMCFDGTDEAFEEGMDGGIPLKYIHKVPDYEVEQLNLKRLQELEDAFQVFGHSDDYYNLIDKFKKESPWL